MALYILAGCALVSTLASLVALAKFVQVMRLLTGVDAPALFSLTIPASTGRREKLLADFSAQAIALAEQSARGLEKQGGPKQPGDIKRRNAVAWLREQAARVKIELTDAEAAKRIELAISGR